MTALDRRTLLAGACGSLLLAGCSGSGSPTRSGSTTSASTSPTTSSTSQSIVASSSVAATGFQPAGAILERIQASGLLFTFQGKEGVSAAAQDSVVAVGSMPSAKVERVAARGVRAAGFLDGFARSAYQTTHGPLLLVPASLTDANSYAANGSFGDAWGVNIQTDNNRQPYVIIEGFQPGIDKSTMIDDDGLLDHVVTHELFHYFTLGSDLPVAPLWLIEGYAEAAGNAVVSVAPRTVPTPASIPTDEELRGSEGFLAYFRAFTVVDYLRSTYGESRLWGSTSRWSSAPAPPWIRRRGPPSTRAGQRSRRPGPRSTQPRPAESSPAPGRPAGVPK